MNENNTYYAYALGYKDGYNEGVEDNHYKWSDEERLFYRKGYDVGVSDYCLENHPEDEE